MSLKFSNNLMKKLFLSLLAFCLTVFVLQTKAQQTASEFFDIGVNKSKAGDYIGASQAYSTAIAMNPENSTSYYNRGLAKQQLKDHRGAILDFDRTIDLDSKNALAYLFANFPFPAATNELLDLIYKITNTRKR